MPLHRKSPGPLLPLLEPGDRWLSSEHTMKSLGVKGNFSLLGVRHKHNLHSHRDPDDRRVLWFRLSEVDRVRGERKLGESERARQAKPVPRKVAQARSYPHAIQRPTFRSAAFHLPHGPTRDNFVPPQKSAVVAPLNELDFLRAENAALRAALMPFAVEGAALASVRGSDGLRLVITLITVGDCRRAASAMGMTPAAKS